MRTTADAAKSPEQCLRRFRETRDPEALGALYDMTAPALFRVALAIAPEASSAENVLQETFLAVLEAPERWDDTRPVLPWLLGILRRKVGSIRRDRDRTPDPLRLVPPLAPDDPASAAATREGLARVRAAIDQLPEPYRTVALLRWRHGLDPAEIAELRRELPGTTRSLLSRALEKLRGRLSAGALALVGLPSSRGIGGVRRAVMTKAPVAASVVAGALIMKKVLAVCLLVLLVGAGTWWAAAQLFEEPGATRPGDDARAAAATTVPAETRVRVSANERRRGAPAPAAETVAAAVDEIPPPVDLDRCDRDLDLFGVVRDEAANPVAAALVRTSVHPWAAVLVASWDLRRLAEDGPATRTARDGTFALRLRRGAVVDLRVTADGFAETVRTNCLAGERVTLTLAAGASLEVSTVDEQGRPVAQVRVRASSSQQSGLFVQECEATTDVAGHVVFGGLVPGRVHVRLRHATLSPAEGQTVDVPASGSVALRVTMLPGRTISGRVTDAGSGAHVAGASVGGTAGMHRFVATDAEGRYEFPGWTGTTSVILVASAPGYCSIGTPVPLAGDLDFALCAGDRVAGRVLRADGTPLEGAYVSAAGGSAADGVVAADGRLHDHVSGRTGADGRFTLAGLQHEAPHLLVVASEGLARAFVDFDPPAEERGEVDVGDIVLREGRAIEGLAVDGDGRPLPEASVSLASADDDRDLLRRVLEAHVTAYEPRRTDDLGRFRFTDIAAGSYVLRLHTARAPSAAPTPQVSVVVPPDSDVTGVRLESAFDRDVTVRVVDDAGAPQEGCVVRVSGHLPQWNPTYLMSLTGRTGHDGRVSLRGLSAKETWFHVDAHRTRARLLGATVGPVVPAGQEIPVTLRRGPQSADAVPSDEGRAETDAPAGRRLSVVVRDSAGTPIPGLQVGVARGPGTPGITDAEGRADLAGLPAHEVTLVLARGAGWTPRRPLDVPPAPLRVVPDGQVVTMDCRSGVALRGRIFGTAFTPFGDLWLSVSSAEDDRYSVRVDSSGRFTVGVLPRVPHVVEGARDDEREPRFSLSGVVAKPEELIVTAGPEVR